MARAKHLDLQPGERLLALVRRHWWTVLSPLLWLIPVLALLPVYAVLDYYLPAARLSRYANPFFAADLGLSGLLFVLWVSRDLAAWWADRYLITDRRVIERRGMVAVRQREASLRSVRAGAVIAAGLSPRLLHYGNLVLHLEDRDATMVLTCIPQVEALRTRLISLAAEARQEYLLEQQGGGPIQAALARIFTGSGSPHEVPTLELERITRPTLIARRRLSLVPGEGILYAMRRHGTQPVAGMALPLLACVGAAVSAAVVWHPPFLLVAAVLAAGIPISALVWWRWRTRLYVLTTDRVLDLRYSLLLTRQRELARLRETSDVVLHVSALGSRLADRGTLVLHGRRGAAPVALAAVPEPDRVKRLIFEAMEAAAERDRLQEKDRLAGTLTDWFEEYHRMQGAP